MNPATSDVIFYALLLVLPASALFARQVPLGQMARMALAWAGIFAVGLLIATAYTRNRGTVDEWLVSAGLKRMAVRGGSVMIPRAPDGHFYADVRLNGVEQRLMIDTGATETAIDPDLAKAAGIATDPSRQQLVNTAGGEVNALVGQVEQMRLGPIRAEGLTVLVAPSFKGGVLGMNFLSRLSSWRIEGDMMILVASGGANADYT
ncbi:MAG: hypothetical protein A4S12_09755 [Proteobacteria bacterium SG_bin5]|nr:TIGR02281 family clan AA aspartic protease [Sphingomonas sp.]OQW40676.1 MAG: hypothetical protein A4S12_09755 [Proteobacteria bacterium SG_bin5]